MNDIKIIYATEALFDGFYAALGVVARERIYIEMIEPPPLEKALEFQKKLIASNWPSFYAVDGERVVGWADITPASNPRLAHRGSLGMGLIAGHRGQGIGTKLLEASITHAKQIGLEKIELNVYTDNKPAIALYRKFGFVVEGTIIHYRKLDRRYFDCVAMAKFL